MCDNFCYILIPYGNKNTVHSTQCTVFKHLLTFAHLLNDYDHISED